jgi:nucleotide-binding universal stress UspA family protein
MISLNNIVVAYDGSEQSKKALDYACWFAAESQAIVHIVLVLRLIPSSILFGTENYGADYFKTLEILAEKVISEKLSQAQAFCEEKKLQVIAKAFHGNIVEEIINYAKSCQADMVICGTRGQGGFKGLLLGSVAREIVTYSPVSVMVVK